MFAKNSDFRAVGALGHVACRNKFFLDVAACRHVFAKATVPHDHSVEPLHGRTAGAEPKQVALARLAAEFQVVKAFLLLHRGHESGPSLFEILRHRAVDQPRSAQFLYGEAQQVGRLLGDVNDVALQVAFPNELAGNVHHFAEAALAKTHHRLRLLLHFEDRPGIFAGQFLARQFA